VRRTENAWWSLAPHDVALAMHLLGASPVSVSVTGGCYLQRERGIEDVAFATLRFANGPVAHLHVSWLDPHKRRSLTVVGTRRMLSFDDALPDGKLKIYDGGALPRNEHNSYAQGVVVPVGDVKSPFLAQVEPLLVECEHFVDCVAHGTRPRSDGRQGLAVVRVLEAGDQSMRLGGAPVHIVGTPAQGEGGA
jgi:predicted dehydrogenase